MRERPLTQIIPSMPASDGAGVKLRRSLGASQALRQDPFLMLDEFFSDNPDDYLAGFPSHPHRGFETVTYMLDGHMQHKDHLGNTGDLRPGDVQWMTAARGIIHSEMPQQHEGRMRGFQLWINLPAALKMQPAGYRDIPAGQIPEHRIDGGQVRVIAGRWMDASGEITGPVQRPVTEPTMLDLHLDAGAAVEVPLPPHHHAFVYVYEGAARIGEQTVPHRAAGLLGPGEYLRVHADDDTRLLVLAAKPLGEPVVQYGPFVMNTREEIEQALRDYRDGTLAA